MFGSYMPSSGTNSDEVVSTDSVNTDHPGKTVTVHNSDVAEIDGGNSDDLVMPFSL